LGFLNPGPGDCTGGRVGPAWVVLGKRLYTLNFLACSRTTDYKVASILLPRKSGIYPDIVAVT
jgi:hypothetical protein